MECPECEGEGMFIEHQEAGTNYWSDCLLCYGEGWLTYKEWLSYIFWNNAPVCLTEWYADILEKSK